MSPDTEPKKRKFTLADYFTGRELSPEERRSVLEDLFVFGKDHQPAFLRRMAILLVLSTVIATAGLISDSAAVVIGAMLVAPLMNPVMAAAGAVIMGWPHRFYSAIWLIAAMGLGALVLSSLITLLSPELVFIPEQVMARTRPTYYDLLIALAAGSAGAYTITRKETSAIPGVAVAVALLPPLASAGILLTAGEYELALRAVILFLTNLVAMVLAGALTFLAVGVSPARQRSRSASFIRMQLRLFGLLTLAICIPLWFYSDKVLFNAHYLAAKSEVLQQWLLRNQLELVDVNIFKEKQTLVLHLTGPKPPVNIGELHGLIQERLQDQGEVTDFVIEYTWTQKITGRWPIEESAIDEIASERRLGAERVFAHPWSWTATQFGSGRTATPPANETYLMEVSRDGDLKISASCGHLKGEMAYSAQTISVTIGPNRFSRCRNDEALRLFTADLQNARDIQMEGDQLQIVLASNSGVMFFKAFIEPQGSE